MLSIQHVLFILLAYLLGSIPVGYLIVKQVMGENILQQGSGNIGSTNVGRVAGKKWSFITQILDMLKGLTPVGICLLFSSENTPELLVYALGTAAILGHNFSLFLKGKGGKGVNTTLGAAVLLSPLAVFGAVASYFLVKWQFKFVSLGSLVLGAVMPLIEWILNGLNPTFYFLLLCFLLILVRHHSNIKRLLHKKELQA